VQDEIPPEQIPTSQVDPRATEDLVKAELELQALILDEVTISPNQSGDQLLTIKLSAPDIATANQVISSSCFLQTMFQSEDTSTSDTETKSRRRPVTTRAAGKLVGCSLMCSRPTNWRWRWLTKDWFPIRQRNRGYCFSL
jgi:hypothetical protein